MAGVTGREVKAAFAKFGTNSWGVAAAVTKGLYLETTGGLKLQPARVNDESFGQPFLGRGDYGDVTAPDLTWAMRSRYDDHTFILDALAMGSPAAATLSNSAAGQTPSYSHVIDLATSTDGLGLTWAIDKVTFVDELTSAKVFGFGEAVGDGGVMDKSYRLLGSKPTNISSTNGRSVVHSASFVSLGNRVFRNHGTFRMNAQTAGALGASDAIKIETCDITFERPQDGPHVFGQDYIHEPADNGHPVCQVKIKYPRMTTISATSLYTVLRTNGVFKADLTFLGAFINSTDKYSRLYQFPHLELDDTNGFAVEGAQQVKPEATFTAKLATTSPTGIPIVNPFRLTLINTHVDAAF